MARRKTVLEWNDCSTPIIRDGKKYYNYPKQSGEYFIVYVTGDILIMKYDRGYWDCYDTENIFAWAVKPTFKSLDFSSTEEEDVASEK